MIGPTTLKLALLNVLVIGLAAAAWCYGILRPLFENDRSHITLAIVALTAAVVAQTTYQAYRLDGMDGSEPHALTAAAAFPQFVKNEVLVILGICGTLIGIMMVTGASVGTDALTPDGLAARVSASYAGLKTGVGASLVGLSCKLWCESIFYIKAKRLRALGWS